MNDYRITIDAETAKLAETHIQLAVFFAADSACSACNVVTVLIQQRRRR
jgi:hypothetical protein